MVCDDTWCAGYGRHEYDPDECPLHTWPPARATLYLPVSNERGRLHLAAKQDAAVYPCRYCGMKLPVSAAVFDENPFCASCLHERMGRMSDPLDGPRLECGLPLERVSVQTEKPLRPLADETTETKGRP